VAANTRIVQHRGDGQWEVRAPGASRAMNETIRAQDTVAPRQNLALRAADGN